MKRTLIALIALAGAAAAETVILTMPGTTNGGGKGSVNASGALTIFANEADGGYMFNNGGQCNTNESTGEGIFKNIDGEISITLCPREGAGGSGEVIVLSGTELKDSSVESFTFDIASITSTAITGNGALTLAVIQNNGNNWSVVAKETGSFTIGSSASLTLEMAESIAWSTDYKVVAMIDNTEKGLDGNNGAPYVLSGISISATTVPEPATATLSLLALAGLAARRRRATR